MNIKQDNRNILGKIVFLSKIKLELLRARETNKIVDRLANFSSFYRSLEHLGF